MVGWIRNSMWASLWGPTISQAWKLYLQCHYLSCSGLCSHQCPVDFHGQTTYSHRPRSFDFAWSSQILSLAYPWTIWLCRSETNCSLLADSEFNSSISDKFIVLCFHVPICWILIFKLELGDIGAAVAFCLSNWHNVILLGLYVKYSSACEATRMKFSKETFLVIGEFFRFAVPAAVMVW